MQKDLRSAQTMAHELKALAVVLRAEFETSFRFYDRSTAERILAPDEPDNATDDPHGERELAREFGDEQQPRVILLCENRYLLVLPLEGIGPSNLIAVGTLPALTRSAADMEQERSRLGKWIKSVYGRLRGSMELSTCRQARSGQDRQSLVAWNAMMGLERLHANMQIHKEPERNRIRVLRMARDVLGASSLAWVSNRKDSDVVIDGERLLSPWDIAQIADFLTERVAGDGSGYVRVNDPRQAPWGARFPRVGNLLAVPVKASLVSGWVLAFNKRQPNSRGPGDHEKRAPVGFLPAEKSSPTILPFRRSDAALLMPFASLIGLHAAASQRYLYMKDVMVGLTRSLTASIDAKDEYTYGHSERVARAAVELGRELGLCESERHDIYLAGLLHDIGKIGIRDDVLTKRGPLTEEEFKHIQQHPFIGHRILSGLHSIDHLLPGVLYHHERFDGRGYPDGLLGDAIPMLARILAVADTFDAMNTSRPYRQAMPAERVDQILREGAGSHWDPLIVDAYFRCRERLVAIRQHGLGDSLHNALDGALRNGRGPGNLASQEFSILG
jgi:HD-GYP domain-containing protein (c-di-GMP phosphodiesterase class II)